MTSFAAGGRRLPPHHVTIRVPSHDGGWTGSVCARPLDNTRCLILPRTGAGRRHDVEARCAGRRLDELERADLPPCVGERVSFMAPFAVTRTITHPYTEFYPDTHGHSVPTSFVQSAYSAACVPFRWTLREKVEGSAKDGEIGIAERLKIGWVSDREPDIRNHQGKEVETAWVQERDNQLAILDTFFGALRPEESLWFFYAKRTPLSEQSRRVIVGVVREPAVGIVDDAAAAVLGVAVAIDEPLERRAPGDRIAVSLGGNAGQADVVVHDEHGPVVVSVAHLPRTDPVVRRDIPILFDAGFVAVTPDLYFGVSRRIKEEFDNVQHCYALHGQRIRVLKTPRSGPIPMPRPGTMGIVSRCDG